MSARYLRPATSVEAAAMCRQPGSTLVGGGTLVMSALWPVRPETLIDLCDIGLNGVDRDGDELHIGALTTVATLATALTSTDAGFGALREAAAAFSPQVVAKTATVGGNIAARTGSLLGPLALLDAKLLVRLGDALQSIAVDGDLTQGGVIEKVSVPFATLPHASGYAVLRRTPTGPGLVSASVGVGDAAVRVVIASSRQLQGLSFAPDTSPKALKAALGSQLSAFSQDPRASDAYRRVMAGVLASRILARLREAAR